jgi:hypothetical protein
MPNPEFLENYPLLKKFHIEGTLSGYIGAIPSPPIHMFCVICGGDRTYNMINSYEEFTSNRLSPSNGQVIRALYQCEACKKNRITFYLFIAEDLKSIIKVGQFPPWEIKIDKNLDKVLAKHAKIFKKGLVCESQGYGIGAFAYYRRIVEDIIDELLISIKDLIGSSEKEIYEAALKEVAKTRVAQDKIDLVRELLPPILMPDGYNPLGVLHSKLSEGLHAETDEDCLEIAGTIRDILIFLVNQIIQSKESAKSFTTGMKKILDKKAGKI